MKRGLVAGFLFALVAGFAWWSNGSNTTYTVQEALNKLIGAKPHEYTTQGALNVILTKPAERDTLVTLFTWVFDDGNDTLWVPSTAWVDSFAAHDQVGTISVIPFGALHGDTTYPATYLSKWDLQALEARGWDLQAHGYRHTDTLWAASGAYAMPRGETRPYQYRREWERAMAAFDTLGLRTPRGLSWPNAGASAVAGEEAARAGFDYGFCGAQTATNGIRYFSPAVMDALFGSRYIAAYPGLLPNPFEIGQCISESNNYSTFRANVFRGIKARGSWIVYIGHNPDTWETTTGYEFEVALAFIDSLRTLGLLDVVTAREGYELMFETPIGPYANFMYPNLPDMDKDNYLDFLWHGTTTNDRDSLQIGLGAHTFTGRGTLDSVFVSTSRPNHGVMGCGYAMTCQNGKYNSLDFSSSISTASGLLRMQYGRDLQFRFPNFAPGQQVTFEFWALVDTTKQHSLPSTADTVGVTFEAWGESYWNKYTQITRPVGPEWWPYGTARALAGLPANFSSFTASYFYNYIGSDLGFGNYSVFGPTNIVGGVWLHVQGKWVVPPWAHYIYVNIIQDSSLKTKAMRVSNFSITRQPATSGQTW